MNGPSRSVDTAVKHAAEAAKCFVERVGSTHVLYQYEMQAAATKEKNDRATQGSKSIDVAIASIDTAPCSSHLPSASTLHRLISLIRHGSAVLAAATMSAPTLPDRLTSIELTLQRTCTSTCTSTNQAIQLFLLRLGELFVAFPIPRSSPGSPLSTIRSHLTPFLASLDAHYAFVRRLHDRDAARSARKQMNAAGGWIRDLATEGIEPNPGPCPRCNCYLHDELASLALGQASSAPVPPACDCVRPPRLLTIDEDDYTRQIVLRSHVLTVYRWDDVSESRRILLSPSTPIDDIFNNVRQGFRGTLPSGELRLYYFPLNESSNRVVRITTDALLREYFTQYESWLNDVGPLHLFVHVVSSSRIPAPIHVSASPNGMRRERLLTLGSAALVGLLHFENIRAATAHVSSRSHTPTPLTSSTPRSAHSPSSASASPSSSSSSSSNSQSNAYLRVKTLKRDQTAHTHMHYCVFCHEMYDDANPPKGAAPIIFFSENERLGVEVSFDQDLMLETPINAAMACGNCQPHFDRGKFWVEPPDVPSPSPSPSPSLSSASSSLPSSSSSSSSSPSSSPSSSSSSSSSSSPSPSSPS